MTKFGSCDYLWLCGENLGATTCNNSFYFWNHVVDDAASQDSIAIIYVLEKTPENIEFVRQLPSHRKKFIVWRNTERHRVLYRQADLLIVTLSYRDVVPNYRNSPEAMLTEVPVIYLQHGTLGMKKLGYDEHTYNNNLLRFVTYNRNIQPTLKKENGFQDYQMLYGVFHPRYQELVRRSRVLNKASRPSCSTKAEKTILWFVTWREYATKSVENTCLTNDISAVVTNPRLLLWLEETNTVLRIALHRQADPALICTLRENANERVVVLDAGGIDIMDEIATADCLITDYSSLAFDFAFLGKPLLLYQPDVESYTLKRGFYCSLDELSSFNYTEASDVVDAIISNRFSVPDFFRKAFPDDIPYADIEKGVYIERLYRYLVDLQKNQIVFLGYNFWGSGGTVSATKALGEALLKQGYMVRLISLKRLKRRVPSDVAGGLWMTAFYLDSKENLGRLERLKRLLKGKWAFASMTSDPNQSSLIPYAGWALGRYVKESNARVICSTRESFHRVLSQCDNRAQKLYFFHCQADALPEVFPGIMEELRAASLGVGVYTTSVNQRHLEDMGIRVQTPFVLGNTLESRLIPSLRSVYFDWLKRKYRSDESFSEEYPNVVRVTRCVTLLRLSASRMEAIDRMFEFASYLKDKNITDIKIYVYGYGELSNMVRERRIDEGLENYLYYKGGTKNPESVLKMYDCLVDFSTIQSFGMTYLESVYNGIVPLCTVNDGSSEIFANSPLDCYYSSWEELEGKIRQVGDIDFEQYLVLRRFIEKRYSQEALSSAFVQQVFGDRNPMESWRSVHQCMGLMVDAEDNEGKFLVFSYVDDDWESSRAILLHAKVDKFSGVMTSYYTLADARYLALLDIYTGFKHLKQETMRQSGEEVDGVMRLSPAKFDALLQSLNE